MARAECHSSLAEGRSRRSPVGEFGHGTVSGVLAGRLTDPNLGGEPDIWAKL